MFKKFAFVFLTAFVLNAIWEFAHHVLYVSYQGGEITNFILFRAAIWDGVYILALFLLAHAFKINKTFFVISGGIILAVAIELWAQQTGRWVYDAAMPLVPFLKIGLTPTIQLALTGLATILLVNRKEVGRVMNHADF